MTPKESLKKNTAAAILDRLSTSTQPNWFLKETASERLAIHMQPAQTALADYLANPGDRRYLEAFTTAAALTSGANTGGQHWSVALAPAQLLNYMAVVTNPAGLLHRSLQF